MLESYTEAALRALRGAQARARLRGSPATEPADVLAALADEPESRAAVLLAEHGLAAARLFDLLGTQALESPEPAGLDPAEPVPHSLDLRTMLAHAAHQARSLDRSQAVGTEHLLAGLLGSTGPITELLTSAGLAMDALVERLGTSTTAGAEPIPLAPDIPPLELAGPGEAVDLGRILDASANRAREGLRVVEDYVRFVLDDPMLTRRLKDVRHRLAEAVRGLDAEALIGSRDTRGDVGTHIMASDEPIRENPRAAVLIANFKRTGEALRTLEEYSKLVDVWLAGRFEVLRYDLYTVEKLTLTAITAHRAIGEARLFVIVGGLPTLGDLTWIVGEALAGGAQVIQLREKRLPDRVVLARAREVRLLTIAAGARFILNDRPDIARLAGADGVHIGQDDLTFRDTRRIVGPRALIGVSTHNREQIDRSLLEGAGYLGVGPVFPSDTKDFSDLAGLVFVRQAAEMSTLPWFAIGGITAENLDQVLQAGAQRIAVSGAILKADSPRQAAANLRARLDAVL